MSDLGKWLVLVGVALVIVGLVAQTGALSWFGRLPGDIRVERPNGSFYFPITSMVVVSIVLSVVLNLVRRFF
jgi:membrane protein implicated in regulation of membrane protease activity